MEGRGQEWQERRPPPTNTVLRNDKLKEIEALFRNQIKGIYVDSISHLQEPKKQALPDRPIQKERPFTHTRTPIHANTPISQTNVPNASFSAALMSSKSNSTLHAGDTSNSKFFQEERVRGSVARGQGRGQGRIRELSSRCEALLAKLQSHLSPEEFEREVEQLRQWDDGKMQRLEKLVQIKKEEVFFKVRLQAVALLGEFGLGKEQLEEVGCAGGEDELFSAMTRLLKARLRDFRSREQQCSFQLQKDRILSQKQEQRIHYLIETNELLRLSEGKLKGKVEDLKNQLNEFLDRLKEKQEESEQLQSQLFQLRKQNEELSSNNVRLSAAVKAVNGERADERRTWEASEKQLKLLLNKYCLDKQHLEASLQESHSSIDELLIKLKFLQQENEHLGRQLVRWKERYEGLEREQGRRTKELQEELLSMQAAFEEYKGEHNQGVLIAQQGEVEQALRKVEEYQRAYEAVLLELEEEKRLLARAEQQHEERVCRLQDEWVRRVSGLEKLREEELLELQADYQAKQEEMRNQQERQEALRAQEMQAHMRALLAEKDKKNTEQLGAYETENDHLRREIENLRHFLRAKEEFINAIKHHSK